MFELVDTTLRDGEQTAGVVFLAEERIKILEQLDKTGIKWIEAGIPAMGKQECEFLRKASELNLNSKLITWNRMKTEDIDLAMSCNTPYVHMSIPVSDMHIKFKFGADRKWVLKQVENYVTYAVKKGATVFLGTEDSSRADLDFFLEVSKVAYECGAERIRFSDTVGILEPRQTYAIFQYLSPLCPLPIEFHGHNDFGLACANTLASYRGGADFASVTITGIGERAGNASLEEVVCAMESLYDYNMNIKSSKIALLQKLVKYAAYNTL